MTRQGSADLPLPRQGEDHAELDRRKLSTGG